LTGPMPQIAIHCRLVVIDPPTRAGFTPRVAPPCAKPSNTGGSFRESDLLRKLFETVVARCMKEGIVGGEAFYDDSRVALPAGHYGFEESLLVATPSNPRRVLATAA
jgi:hypothetical protein